MELVKAGTLMTYLQYKRQKHCPLKDGECSCIMKQILEGLAYIHKLNIVHRDIKPQNILMRSIRTIDSSVKIADFGMGTQESCNIDKCGTMIYMAPEQFAKTGYGKVTR
eukprot:TRINITY_DN6459_c0_g6_i1.p7 TRINITY_DN6459_c0_g6~~TRINITY_DN6459_c0_g6_i1.p7  ORF type:complete len:109 (-),score=29.27 TRINITY_DN6459_c0_g6_i1:990-1316(-)